MQSQTLDRYTFDTLK